MSLKWIRQGTGFQLFTQTNGVSGIYADAAARDVYFGANPADLAICDANPDLIIKLLDDGAGSVAYQQRQGGVWVDVTSLVQGEDGPAGATGNSFFFESVAARDTFFGTGSNKALLMNGLPVQVNEGTVATVYYWSGLDSPAGYDPDLFRPASVGSSPGSLFLGSAGLSISSASRALNVIDAYGQESIGIKTRYDKTGNEPSFTWDFSAASVINICPTFSTQLSEPFEFLFPSPVSSDTMSFSYEVRPATSGKLRTKIYAGTDNTFPVISDSTITVEPGDVGNLLLIPLPNRIVTQIGDDVFAEYSGVDLFGGVQASGAFVGQTKPFLDAEFSLLTPKTIASGPDVTTDNSLAYWIGTDGTNLGSSTISFLIEGAIDGRLDIEPVAANGAAILTLSNAGGGTGLEIEHDAASDNSLISGEIGNLTIRTTEADEDILITPTGNVGIDKGDPDSVLHIYEDTTETGIQAGLTIEQDGSGDAIVQFLLTGGQRWVAGLDNSGSDAFKIASTLDLASNAQLVLETDGRSEFLGSLGVNILPASIFHVYEDTANVDATAGLTIEQDGAGDAVAQFLLTGSQRWVMGIDNSFDDNFVFAKSADLNSNQQLVLQADGKSNFFGTLGVGQAPADGYRLDVLTSISVHARLSTFKAVTIESGKNGSGNSTDFFFNRDNVGFNQSEFTLFNDNNASSPARMFRMGYSDDIDTSGGLTVWKTRNNVAVGTYSLPDSVFTVSENTTETGDQAGLTIIQEGSGDAIAQFLLDGGQRWVMGIDNSGNDAFKIASSINLGSNDMFVLEPDAGAFLYSHTDDVLTLGNSTGEQSKISIDDAGSPEGVVTGTGGDIHINVDGEQSIASMKKSAASGTANWYDFDLVPPLIKVIYNTAEFEAMASGGIITVSSNTTWIFKGHIDSDVRVVFDGATLHISTDQSNQASWTYSGTGTLLTGEGGLRSLEFFDILASSTGTFADLDMGGRSMNLTLAGLFNWDDLGTLANGTFILDVSDIFDNVLGFDMINMKMTLTQSNITNTPTGATSLFTVDNSFGAKSVNVDQMTGSFNAGASLFRFEPALNDAGKVAIGGFTAEGGEIFDTSGATGEFSAVADAAVAAENITSVTDSGGVARFIFTAPPTLFVNQEVVISGFTTNTAYNGTYVITATGANYFEVATIAFGSNETGSFLSNSVTITDTGTALVDGDQVTLDTFESIDYDGGAVVYNQLTNTFQVNRTFTSTHTGTWSQAGLDQTDPRILAFNNPDFIDSKYIGFGHIEENPVANTTVIGVTDTYQAVDVTGTTGFVTVFADNGSGGTTCTSAAHGLVENQNVVLSAGDEYYRGEYTIFNVLAGSFDIARTFQSTVLTSDWISGFNCDTERFKCTDPAVGEMTYIGNEPFDGTVKLTFSVNKVGSSQDYLFSAGKNGVAPEQGAPFQRRTVTTATSVHPVTIPVSLTKGDTVQPIVASVATTNSVLMENVQMEVD